MFRDWTFGQKLGGGFAVTVVLALLIGAIAVWALEAVVTAKDSVISVDAANLSDAQRLGTFSARKSAALRGYLLAPQQRHRDELDEQQKLFWQALSSMDERVQGAEQKRLLLDVERRAREHDEATQRGIALKGQDPSFEVLERAFEADIAPHRDRLMGSLELFIAHSRKLLEENTQAATRVATSARDLTVIVAISILLFAVAVAVMLVRTLSRQIGTTVAQVQSSSAELQAAANQQATASKQQATAMTEISTTITELLATSRQIAESAQSVSRVADLTVDSARTGDATVERAHQSIVSIRRQVDLIVSHMLDLGKKSQQIGAVLDIVSELAEQTNILAINATIEAAGAGDAGRRFSVVADEIRKLADRVTGSTKEVRTLIDDVRNSVNTTVMTTESGSKAVDAGSKQFAEVASAFKQIVGQLSTTTDAAREIGLSTKQQASAVEQVNVAITNVAQASRETEASSGQTLQTASQLSTLSRELLRLVESDNQRYAPPRG
jgi:methyl-accepting chemotaxis protein